MPANGQWGIPMEAISGLAFRRLWTQTPQLAVSQIDPVHFALLAFRVKRVAISWIEQDMKAVAAGEGSPIAIANRFLTLHTTWPDPVLIVLKSAGDAKIRFRVVQRDTIKFSRRNFVQMIPILAACKTLINAAVCAE